MRIRSGWWLLCMLPVLGSELGAYLWMHPPAPKEMPAVLELRLPDASPGWKLQPDLYSGVVPSLRCTGGWIGEVAEQNEGPALRVAFFKWDAARTVNTLEAFKHLPEQCMGSIGMNLEQIHPRRIHHSHGGTLVFDSTVFRPSSGGRSVHVFKSVWVSGLKEASLRDGVLSGSSGTDLRRLRLAAGLSRFRPSHTRVLMGAVAGMPSEELAWHRFSTAVLGNLQWEPPGGR